MQIDRDTIRHDILINTARTCRLVKSKRVVVVRVQLGIKNDKAEPACNNLYMFTALGK